MYNKTIIIFRVCDIENNQGLGKVYQPQLSASAEGPYVYVNLDYYGYHKNLIPKLFIHSIQIKLLRFKFTPYKDCTFTKEKKEKKKKKKEKTKKRKKKETLKNVLFVVRPNICCFLGYYHSVLLFATL